MPKVKLCAVTFFSVCIGGELLKKISGIPTKVAKISGDIGFIDRHVTK